MSVDNQTINILDLPYEVLREILSYVPNQLVVGEVCKTFYQISCKLIAYRLKISTEEESDFYKFADIENDGVYESIINSSRQIDSLYIKSAHKTKTINQLRSRKVLEQIGWHIKKLEMYGSFNINDISLLNLMPNLEKIKFFYCEGLQIYDNFKLRLNKLKKLIISSCSEKILEVFDYLPDDVLQKLTCDSLVKSGEKPRKYFQNQRNIKHFSSHRNFLKLSKLKLKSLNIKLGNNYLNILKRQDELTSLNVWASKITDELLNFICTQLKLLEEFELYGHCEEFVNFEKLQNLKNLKNFSILTNKVESLNTIKSKSLVCLDVSKFSEEVCLSLSVNCPNIREIKYLDYRGNFDVEKTLHHLTKLERLHISADILTFTENWENQTLKHIWITFVHDFSIMLEFLKRCKGLKTLSIGELNDEPMQNVDLKNLLIEVPNLKTLCLHHFDPENAEIIKEHGQNLECIHQQNFDKREDFEKFREVLKDLLPVSKNTSNYGYTSFILKKYGTVQKCCDLFENVSVDLDDFL